MPAVREPRALALVGMLGAASFILMATIQVPLLPAAPYLRYDPSDVVGLVAAVTMGPVHAATVVAAKDLLYFFFRARSVFGPLANFIAVATFVFVAGWVYRIRRRSGPGPLLVACGAGALARVVVMVPANFIILNLQLGMPAEKVASLIWPVIIPFNAAASVINTALSVLLFTALWRRGLSIAPDRPPSPP